jgi:cytochrome c-type biogenesis protein CcmH/NrfG
VLDADVHQLLGASLLGLKQYPRAVSEYETALELKPEDVDLQLGLAEALIAAGRKADAKQLINKVIAKRADHEKARRLQQSLE